MQALIIFDVNQGENAIKTEMIRLGYFTRWVWNDITYNLPHNVVWKPEMELKIAQENLNRVIDQLNTTPTFSVNRITLLRCLVVSSTTWEAWHPNSGTG